MLSSSLPLLEVDPAVLTVRGRADCVGANSIWPRDAAYIGDIGGLREAGDAEQRECLVQYLVIRDG